MARIKLDYVVSDVDRHGNVRHYFRRGGRKTRLPGPVGSHAYLNAYADALAASQTVIVKARPPRQISSFERACATYYKSATFGALDPSTRSWRCRELDRIVSEGVGEIEDLTRRVVVGLVAERPTPAASNQRLKALKALLKFAVSEGLVSHNAAADVKKTRYPARSHRAWSFEEIERFVAVHPPGSKAFLAFAILLAAAG